MAIIADWMKQLGGYEVVDEKARQRLDNYDEQLPTQFEEVDKKIDDVNNELTEHINAADTKMNQMNTDLTDKIDTVNTNLTKKIDNNKTETDNDIEGLTSKLNTMNANLSNAISSALINSKNYTNTKVAEEAELRTAADDKLQDNIDAEADARLAGDNALSEDITNEADLRRDADTALEKKITSETSARQSADQLLQQNINTEANTRTEADNALGERIDETNATITEEVGRLDKAIQDVTAGVQTDLANYYLKSQTYSRDEVLALINALPKFSIEVVSALPTENISSTTVYLLKTGDESSNIYTEYIYSNGAWESLGTQKVDLSGYALKTDLNGYLPLSGGTISNSLTFMHNHPIYFTYIGNGTYNIGVLQFEADGMTIETPRKTDAANGEILPFNIKTRGGQYAPFNAGDMRSNGSKVLTAADITIENGVTVIDLG